jgi:hypothetical protein
MTNKEMAKKRAPGANRKPRWEFKGKSATLTTRITAETRAAMERAAQKSRRSLSQEVERRLNDSVLNDRNRRSDVRALVEAIAIVAEKVEIATGKHWLQDAFTGDALRHGIEVLVRHFAPHSARVIPPKVEETAARVLPEASERDRSPSHVGEIEALKVITIIEHFGGWDTRRIVMSDELYRYLRILRDLGSGAERIQAALQEAQAALQEKERRR